jgi:hypothetical protein
VIFWVALAGPALAAPPEFGAVTGAGAVTGDELQGPARPSLGLTAALGVRSDLIRGAGLDPFSRHDGVTQSALSVSRRFGPSDLSGVALGFEWDHGSTAATARGADSSLDLDRLSLTVEGRVPLARRLVAFARVAPGLMREAARLTEASAPATADASQPGVLQSTAWVAAADASVGLDFRLGELRRPGTPLFGFWLTAEGGYGYVAKRALTLGGGADGQPGQTSQPLRLGDLALSGPFMRFRFAVSF